MRELQTWGSKPPRRQCEKTESGSDVIICIIAIALGAAILILK